jgi:hypothetical protein
MVAFTYRVPAGIPGQVNRVEVATIEPAQLLASNPPTAYGLPVVVDPATGAIRPVGAGDTAANVYGVLARPFPTSGNGTDGLGVSTPSTIRPGDVLRRGYVAVLVNGAAVAAKGGTVYVRIASPGSGKPVGGFEAAADGANTIQLTTATFTGAADSSGNGEIAFNI